MQKTEAALIEQAKLRWAFENRPEGEEWEFEYGHWGFDDVTGETPRPTFEPELWYRRKPEPPKPFRAFVNVYEHVLATIARGGSDQFVCLHASKESADSFDNRREMLGTVLPADELARLEREHGEMAEQIALIVNPTWNSMCGPKYLISESRFKAIKAIHERMTCDS
jgi:hypothetical protein